MSAARWVEFRQSPEAAVKLKMRSNTTRGSRLAPAGMQEKISLYRLQIPLWATRSSAWQVGRSILKRYRLGMASMLEGLPVQPTLLRTCEGVLADAQGEYVEAYKETGS